MQEDLKLKERIVNQIALAEVAADNFMHELKGQEPEWTNPKSSIGNCMN